MKSCDLICLDTLRVLSDPTRHKIILLFAHNHKEFSASDIAKNFLLSRPTVSHHLNLMKRAHVLNARKSGKEVYYSFNKSHVLSLLSSIHQTLAKCC